MKKFIAILVLFTSMGFSQTINPDEVLNNVKQNFERIKNYIVDINVHVDVNFLKIPDSKAKLYYKQPDKIQIKSEQFALLPKEGLNFSPLSFLEKKYTAIYQKQDTVNGVKTDVIKIIPLDENSEVVLTTLWVDPVNNIILKSESSTKTTGTFAIDLKYKKSQKYPLPDEMIFSFNVDKLNIPKMLTGDPDSENDDEKKRSKKRETTGRVYITYSNYKVNTNIPDSIFEEQKGSGKKK